MAVTASGARRRTGSVRGILFLVLGMPWIAFSSGCRHAPGAQVAPAQEEFAAEPASPSPSGVPPELSGTSWRLDRIQERALDPELPAVILSFDSGRARGSAGCNWYTAWLKDGDPGRLRISHLAATHRTCVHPRIMGRESEYLAALEQVEAYRLHGERLILTAATASLEFRRE